MKQSREFETNVGSVAAAIPSADGSPSVAALVLFGPAGRLTAKAIEQAAPLVIQAAHEIAQKLST